MTPSEFEKFLMPDRIEGKPKVNALKWTQYKMLCYRIDGLAQEGKCTFDYDDPSRPQEFHGVRIYWKPNQLDILEIEVKELLEAISDAETLCVDVSKANGMWELFIQIYEPN